MRIGILISSIGNFGQTGFYNAQEIGLAKEMDKLFSEVIIYKAVPESHLLQVTMIEECRHSKLCQIPVRSKGINGVWDCRVMDPTIDALIYFSDTQLAVPKVFKWCVRHEVKMFPYIGVIESHSTNRLKKRVIDILFHRNLKVYKKCICLVKTPTVKRELNELGIKNIVEAPVGLDLTLLHRNYEKASASDLKKKYGYSEKDKVLLFIGRLIKEKQPLRMIEILAELRKGCQKYKLLMVGTGVLKTVVEDKIKRLNLGLHVQIIERISNREIWELYRFAEVFVNLNQQEIFGMSILEAMYYGCKVVAWKAPGPNLIIEDRKSGWIVESNQEVIERILDTTDVAIEAHQRVIREFTWASSAKKIFAVVGE